MRPYTFWPAPPRSSAHGHKSASPLKGALELVAIAAKVHEVLTAWDPAKTEELKEARKEAVRRFLFFANH